jgi:CRISPR-associated protein Csb2
LESAHGELDLKHTPVVAQRWRDALLSHSNGSSDSVRRLVSGHAADGAPLSRPHLAFVPLVRLAGHGAPVRIAGMALALPLGVPAGDRSEVLGLADRVRALKLGALGVWCARPLRFGADADRATAAWTAMPSGATRWATMTPVAFDRHPKARDPDTDGRECADMIAEACVAIGLPRPCHVAVSRLAAHAAMPPANEFPKLLRKDGSERRQLHATLQFDEAVLGPILLGAGRYRGYGVCVALERG